LAILVAITGNDLEEGTSELNGCMRCDLFPPFNFFFLVSSFYLSLVLNGTDGAIMVVSWLWNVENGSEITFAGWAAPGLWGDKCIFGPMLYVLLLHVLHPQFGVISLLP
jgi:hypothetical protein